MNTPPIDECICQMCRKSFVVIYDPGDEDKQECPDCGVLMVRQPKYN